MMKRSLEVCLHLIKVYDLFRDQFCFSRNKIQRRKNIRASVCSYKMQILCSARFARHIFPRSRRVYRPRENGIKSVLFWVRNCIYQLELFATCFTFHKNFKHRFYFVDIIRIGRKIFVQCKIILRNSHAFSHLYIFKAGEEEKKLC